MYYRIACEHPNQHLLAIDLWISGIEEEELELQMPFWRPGRYREAEFARNVMRVQAYGESGLPLNVEKLRKDRWKVHCAGSGKIRVHYRYYAHEMTAGASYVDEEQLYVNPVSCLLYVPDREDHEHCIELDIPDDHRLASGLEFEGDRLLKAENMQRLMDAPFIASPNMKHHSFDAEGCRFHLWFQGPCKPDMERIENDLIPFIREQVHAFGEFPVEEYHFLYQVLPYRTFHGVEHADSTVIVLGPSPRLMDPESVYEEFVAVSSHELYHTWNIKRIRPEGMAPYDFTRENHTRLGYIAEGVTSYMGDLMLLRSSFYSEKRYLEKLARLLQRHFENPGRHNLSVADSSFDTWLDGYDREVPGRKVSIYNEGALIAFMLDVLIQEMTEGEARLDEVMKKLYHSYLENGKGFSEEELIRIVEELTGASFRSFFAEYVNGTSDYEVMLKHCFDRLGIHWERRASFLFHEAWLGVRCRKESGYPVVSAVCPASPASRAGVEPGDRWIGINGFEVSQESLSSWCAHFGDETIGATLVRDGRILERTMEASSKACFCVHDLSLKEKRDRSQLSAYETWKRSSVR